MDRIHLNSSEESIGSDFYILFSCLVCPGHASTLPQGHFGENHDHGVLQVQLYDSNHRYRQIVVAPCPWKSLGLRKLSSGCHNAQNDHSNSSSLQKRVSCSKVTRLRNTRRSLLRQVNKSRVQALYKEVKLRCFCSDNQRTFTLSPSWIRSPYLMKNKLLTQVCPRALARMYRQWERCAQTIGCSTRHYGRARAITIANEEERSSRQRIRSVLVLSLHPRHWFGCILTRVNSNHRSSHHVLKWQTMAAALSSFVIRLNWTGRLLIPLSIITFLSSPLVREEQWNKTTRHDNSW